MTIGNRSATISAASPGVLRGSPRRIAARASLGADYPLTMPHIPTNAGPMADRSVREIHDMTADDDSRMPILADADELDPNACASVLTLVRGRQRQLRQLIEGLLEQTVMPGELVIAFMQPRPTTDLPETPFPVRSLVIDRDYLPLAEARNAAARSASYRNLVFLDVDCVPAPTLVETYVRELRQGTGMRVLQGEVIYLPELPDDVSVDYRVFDREGRPHPSRPAVPQQGTRLEPDMGMLWGLNFALRRKLFLKVGGLDERFVGYGGEETDFARGLAEVGGELHWCGGARAYHQHHTVVRPPLQHFGDIVRNARLYHEKWGEWCMDYWLTQLHERGYIHWDKRRITVLRKPSAADIQAARCSGETLFS